jgi:hypothetical protein
MKKIKENKRILRNSNFTLSFSKETADKIIKKAKELDMPSSAYIKMVFMLKFEA